MEVWILTFKSDFCVFFNFVTGVPQASCNIFVSFFQSDLSIGTNKEFV